MLCICQFSYAMKIMSLAFVNISLTQKGLINCDNATSMVNSLAKYQLTVENGVILFFNCVKNDIVVVN
eukprot:Pgem_evm1s8913